MFVHVPNNVTDQFQPLDLNVNDHTKAFLKGMFECWFAQQITDQLKGGSSVHDVQVPLKLKVIKLIHAKWLLEFYDQFRNSSDSIIKGIGMAAIKEALVMKLLLEDRFADLDY